MGKQTIVALSALTIIWMIFTEEVSVINTAVGIFLSAGCIFFLNKFFPFKKLGNVNYWKLVTFPFYLIAQIYVAGFQVIKIILTGARVNIITLETKITDEALRIILVDSITLTPGSILLDLDNDKVTLLWFRDKNTPCNTETADEQLKKRLENRLLKAQK